MSRQVFVLISMFLNKEQTFLSQKQIVLSSYHPKNGRNICLALIYIHIEGSAESGKYFVPILDDMRTMQFGFEIS